MSQQPHPGLSHASRSEYLSGPDCRLGRTTTQAGHRKPARAEEQPTQRAHVRISANAVDLELADSSRHSVLLEGWHPRLRAVGGAQLREQFGRGSRAGAYGAMGAWSEGG
ncbi:hypothetical protein GCM10010339_86560 [Streptomyces alanosinicus]|uniref:Uncharacterized protein n=1 Tax=Streptomyces alanosinicus TaxID=68171 RepID=A0A918YTA9_9ACTN|nr:hypothetical protein GCM10010339_86560 [Streptomyces alanosinicus]